MGPNDTPGDGILAIDGLKIRVEPEDAGRDRVVGTDERSDLPTLVDLLN